MKLHRQLQFCSLLFLMLFSVITKAELQPFPYSSVQSQKVSEVPDYRLVLSPVSKVNGRLHVNKSRRLNANMVRVLYRLNDGFDLSEVWNFYQQQLQRENAEVWYQCYGRDCGVSALWANSIFGKAKLSGLEQSQHYGVYHWRSSGRSHIAVLYGIVRANKRNYLLVDQLTASVDQVAEGPVTKKSDLPVRGQTPILIPVSLNASNRLVMTTSARTQVATLSQKLLAMRPQRIYFVGHYTSDEGLDVELEKSELLAEQLKNYVMSTVSGLRMDVHAVGPLSSTHPESNGLNQWVELFVEN